MVHLLITLCSYIRMQHTHDGITHAYAHCTLKKDVLALNNGLLGLCIPWCPLSKHCDFENCSPPTSVDLHVQSNWEASAAQPHPNLASPTLQVWYLCHPACEADQAIWSNRCLQLQHPLLWGQLANVWGQPLFQLVPHPTSCFNLKPRLCLIHICIGMT